MKRRVLQASVVVAMTAVFTVPATPSQAKPSVPERIAAGTLRPAQLKVPGGIKRMPFLSPGRIDRLSTSGAARAKTPAAPASPGIAVRSAGCAERNLRRNVRVNQDCTYRRQAEEHIAADPNDPKNLVAGMNDSLIGWNRTSIDFSVDGGRHWGAISTAPFGYRLNDPSDLLPTATDPNRHTIRGGAGTLHSYDACSDPYLAADSRGRFFYTCVGFDVASNAGLAFVVPSPPGAKGSYFDQVPAPEGLTPPYTGREHIIAEDNSPAASYDAPKVAADAFVGSPNRDNVYFTWTVFDFSCGPDQDEYCESPVWGSMSTDHGFTWSTPEKISGVNPAVCTLGNAFNPDLDPGSCNLDGHSDLVVRPNGELAVTFISQNTTALNPETLSLRCRPGGSSTAGTAHLNCGTPQKVADYVTGPTCDFGRGPEQCIPGAYIRAPFETAQRLSVDERTGVLYNTWYDYRLGEFDVFVVRSTDGGATWTTPRLVNPDRGTDHYFSAIDVGERHATKVAISYYRTGRVPNENTPPPGGFGPDVANQMSDYVLSGGLGLTTPYRFEVLSPRFPPPDGIQAGFNGDYSGIEVDRNDIAHPIWSDTRNRVPNPDFNKASVDEDVFTEARPIPVR
nr:hypothetical protein [uncultured Actinoplanes sp.]